MALDTTHSPLDTNSEIKDAVKSLYGFNLGFALEGRVGKNTHENVERIKIDIVDLLTSNRVQGKELTAESIDAIRDEMENLVENIISKEVLSQTAIKYSGYKSDVEGLKGAKF